MKSNKNNSKLPRSFYQRPAVEAARDFLGKYLVYNTAQGQLAGIIIEVEAYPAFIDKVSHGNVRTKRTQIMYGEGGHLYVYLIYGSHYLFGVVVNKLDVPDMVLIRALIPVEGIEIMKKNFGKPVKNINDLTKSPGNLSKSFGINMDLYGIDLQGDTLYIEDRGYIVKPDDVKISSRIGINKNVPGNDLQLRYYIKI